MTDLSERVLRETVEVDDFGECRHGIDAEFCSTCRAETGYRPGTDRFANDCTVETFCEITGVEYDEAVEILLDVADYRPGHGVKIEALREALDLFGFRTRTVPYNGTLPTTGTYIIAAYKQRSAHAWTLVDGVGRRVGSYYRPGTRIEIVEVR